MQKIYFLCTGNSCRSQMAEGYGHALLPSDQFEVKSAGIETHGLNPQAVAVMAEDGVDISRQTSDLLDATYLQAADLIITLCGDAKDKCPAIPPAASQLHWDLQDPGFDKSTCTGITQRNSWGKLTQLENPRPALLARRKLSTNLPQRMIPWN